MDKKISIVIPTYRRPNLLIKCIEALLTQQFSKDEYEVIVVSDGPDKLTEKALDIFVKSTGCNISYLSLPQKKGPAAARNLGWLQAKGKLIAFTDDDCIPDINWLSDIWIEYKGSEEIAFSGTVIVPLPQEVTDYALNTANLEKAEFVTANCVCTKKALLKTGGFDERFDMAWREDSDLHFKLISNNIPVVKIQAKVIHPVREATWGVSVKEQKKGLFNALLYKKYPDLYKSKIQSKTPPIYYALILFFLVAIVGAILNLKIVFLASAISWLSLELLFIAQRLSATSKSFSHISEMVVTSIAIPFLSVYWQLYGAYKFRVLFI